MTTPDVKIGQLWEWNYKNRGFPFTSSIYLIVNKRKLYDGSSVLPPHLTQYIFDLVEISRGANTRICQDFMEADNWKLLIDVEPNR